MFQKRKMTGVCGFDSAALVKMTTRLCMVSADLPGSQSCTDGAEWLYVSGRRLLGECLVVLCTTDESWSTGAVDSEVDSHLSLGHGADWRLLACR